MRFKIKSEFRTVCFLSTERVVCEVLSEWGFYIRHSLVGYNHPLIENIVKQSVC